MSLREAILRSIIEMPDDDAPRLIYADWLDENGQCEQAEFIRVQCRLAAIDADDPLRRDLQRREYELLTDHWGKWAGPLVGRVRRWQFRRGFVEQVKLEAGQFLKEAKWLLGLAPIQELHVKYPKLEDLRALVASKHIRRITRLNLDHAELGDAGLSLLAASPNLSGLTELSVKFNNVGIDGLTALAGSPRLRSLRSIVFGEMGNIGLTTFRAFVSSCGLPLDRLAWDEALRAEGMQALASSPLARRLKALCLRNAELGPAGLRLLAESPAFTRLEELSFVYESAGDEGAAELARSTRIASLRRLCLSCSKIGPDGAQALAASPLCNSLTRLDLTGNPISDHGAKALANSPHLSNLRRLDLNHCGLTRHGARALLSSPHLDRLTCLQLEENPIGREAFDDLHARLGEHLFHEHFNDGLDAAEAIRRVKAQPPRCLRGLGARPDTELIRRFPRDRIHDEGYPCVAFQLTHADPRQKAVLLGYEDPRGSEGYGVFCSPFAIRWEPSGEQQEFFDAEQHGRSGEGDNNCTITGLGKRKAWDCGRRGCRDHTFIVTFIYRLEYPPERHPARHLPFADQFYHIDLDAYCTSQDRMIEIESFECK